MAADNVEWIFSPPSAPHLGVSWERLIRSCKSAMGLVLKDRKVKEEVLQTMMVEVEGLLNARPLTHSSIYPEDLSPLSPNHFILNRPHPHISPDVISGDGAQSRRR